MHHVTFKILDAVDPVILDSARKHGVGDEDSLHAYRYPIRVFDLGDIVMLSYVHE
jgi:hypothetical protein